MGARGTPDERFWRYVAKGESCWEWTGLKSDKGYGRLNVGASRVDFAHRISYRIHAGPIPSGMVIDHLCRNRACVNPAHLEIVTSVENLMRGIPGSLKGRCRRGHDPSRFARKADGSTAYCRDCRNIDRRARYRTDPAYRADTLARRKAAYERSRSDEGSH